MRAALVREIGALPELGEAPEPSGEDGRILVEVLAAPLNPLDLAVGAGRFYGGHPELPYVPGCEAVGRRRDSGELVWIFSDALGLSRNGAFAELASSSEEAAVPVPDGADPALAAALGIAGLAGWLPLVWRAPIHGGETVLVLGATGTVGIVAVQTARLRGAGRVVAVGRDAERLRRAEQLGADATVTLEGEDLAERLKEACGGSGADIVFDPLWGAPLAAALAATAPGARIVQLGQSAGPEATLTSNAIRGKHLELLGYTDFSVPREVLLAEYPRLVEHAVAGSIELDLERVPLERVGEAWERQRAGSAAKLVLVP